MPNFPASSGSSSTLILAKVTSSAYFAASLSKVGASIRQGAHHSAQKSTKTGLLPASIAGHWSFWTCRTFSISGVSPSP